MQANRELSLNELFAQSALVELSSNEPDLDGEIAPATPLHSSIHAMNATRARAESGGGKPASSSAPPLVAQLRQPPGKLLITPGRGARPGWGELERAKAARDVWMRAGAGGVNKPRHWSKAGKSASFDAKFGLR